MTAGMQAAETDQFSSAVHNKSSHNDLNNKPSCLRIAISFSPPFLSEPVIQSHDQG
jgi:hypothetical protein